MMTTPEPKPPLKPALPVSRKPSTKTLARQLTKYVVGNPKIKSTDTIRSLFDALATSIVEEEVGVSLDVWGEA